MTCVERELVAVQNYFSSFHGVLSVYLTNKCNVECAHCGVNSGPAESGKLSLRKLMLEIPRLAAGGTLRALHIGGGEPMLYSRDIAQLAKCAQDCGLKVAINTNVSWARTLSKAKAALDRIPGVGQLMISTDEYHERFIPVQAVINAVSVALDRGILVDIYVCTPGGRTTAFVNRLKEALRPWVSEVGLHVGAVEYVGRARELQDGMWRTRVSIPPSGSCSLLNRPVVLPNSEVFACCNTTGAEKISKLSPLKLGNLAEEVPLQEILNRSRDNVITEAISILGPAFVYNLLEETTKKRIGGEFEDGNICTVCSALMSDGAVVMEMEEKLNDPSTRRKVMAAKTLMRLQ